MTAESPLGSPAADPESNLREAAFWVVLNWDNEATQHGSMPALREALGFPRERPTREEAQARLAEYLRDPTQSIQEICCNARRKVDLTNHLVEGD